MYSRLANGGDMTPKLGLWLLAAALAAGAAAEEAPFDLVIHGGRVMDPESGTDAVRDVGITAGQRVLSRPHTQRGRPTLETLRVRTPRRTALQRLDQHDAGHVRPAPADDRSWGRQRARRGHHPAQ